MCDKEDNSITNKTRKDKMIELNIPPDKWIAFTDTAVDFIYEKLYNANAIMSKEEEGLIYFVNKILDILGNSRINRVTSFTIDRTDIITLDGDSFINQYRDKLMEYGIHINNDLYYLYRKKMKSYGLSVLKGLCKFFGFTLISKNRMVTDKDSKHVIIYYTITNDIDTA